MGILLKVKDQWGSHTRKEMIRNIEIFYSIWPVLLVASFWVYVHNVVHNLAFYFTKEYEVYNNSIIHDFGFDLLGTALKELNVVPANILLSIIFVFAIISASIPLVLKRDYTLMGFFWRWCSVSIFTVTFRCISFIFTIFPSPADHCRRDTIGDMEISDVFTRMTSDGGCGDLIFSGHTNYAILCLSCLCFYTRSRMMRVLFVLMGITEGILIVAQTSHYSVDVIIALYTVPATFTAFAYFYPEDPQPKITTEDVDRFTLLLSTESSGMTSLDLTENLMLE